jgi:multisubunit Na+/H+ antiporter MnhB subunit
MATKLWHVPVRLATGAIILDQGLSKLGADEDTAKWLHGQAVLAFPQVQDIDPRDFAQLLAVSEITLGVALLGIGLVPSGLAGAGLTVFAGGLSRLYLSIPGARRDDSLAPSQQGIALAKDSWMLAIGTALVLDSLSGSGRRRRRRG